MTTWKITDPETGELFVGEAGTSEAALDHAQRQMASRRQERAMAKKREEDKKNLEEFLKQREEALKQSQGRPGRSSIDLLATIGQASGGQIDLTG